MKRRYRIAVALVALASHAFVPFVAYARAAPAAAFSDYCSVYGNAATPAPGIPVHPAGKHAPTHCAYCPGGSASAAIAPLLAPAIALAPAIDARFLDAGDSAPAGTRILIPPSRGPPATPALF